MEHILRIFISPCQIATSFVNRVTEAYTNMGFQGAELEVFRVGFIPSKSEEEILNQYCLTIRCNRTYCPGCKSAYPRQENSHYLPVVMIDDCIVSHGCFPKISRIIDMLGDDKNI